VLARLTFYVSTPALLFTTLAEADVAELFTTTLLATSGSVAVVALVVVVVSGLVRRRPVADTTVTVLASSYVNAGNLGIAVAAYALGDASLVAPVLLFQVLVMAPVALAVLDTTSTAGRRSVLRVATQPIRTPVTISCLAGLALSATGSSLPGLVMQPVDLIAGTAVPLALMAYGLSLHGSPRPGSEGTAGDLGLVVVLKVVVQPGVAYLLGRYALGLDGTPLLAVAVTTALPTAQNVFVYAATYGRGTTIARDAVLVTTVLSVPALLAVVALAA
jgi:malonate transporter